MFARNAGRSVSRSSPFPGSSLCPNCRRMCVGLRRSTDGHGPGTRRPGGATVETLRAAARERRSVCIGFVDGHGVAGEQVLEPTSVGGGVVEGRDSVDGGLHRVPLHRITSIALVED